MRHSVSRFLALLILSLSLVVQPGCAAVVSKLPIVIGAVTDATMILDSIQSFIEAYFARHPELNQEAKDNVTKAMGRTRAALHAALRIAQGAQKLDQAQVDAAFSDFRVAYTELLALIAPLGVSSSSSSEVLRATPDGLVVPEPLAVELKVD